MLASPPLLPVTNHDDNNNRTFTKLLVQSSDVAQVANIVQLFHKRYIDFRLGETELVVEASTSTSATEEERFQQNKIEPYHLISYHTVEKKKILDEDDDEDNDDPYSSTVMGVWNCQTSISLTETNPWNTTLIERVLLDQFNTSNPSNTRSNHLVILLTLDLNEPSTVTPIVNSVVPLLQKVYQLFDHDLPSFGDPPPIKEQQQHNEELKDERDLQPIHRNKLSANESESNARNNVLFFFTCILPIHDPSTFKEKQIQALLTYHLHRYAFLTNSSLVFVCPTSAATCREHESTSTALAGKALSSNGMDIITFTKIIYRLATPAPLVEEDEGDTATIEEGIGDLLHKNYMFTPKDHDETMIETILRRNANCEGLWDVEKDSLPNILPLQQLPTTTRSRPQQQPNAATTDYSDDAWLSKLASSTIRFTEVPSTTSATTTSTVAVELPKSSRPIIPQEKKKSTTTDTTSIDPTSFFESLLKKS